MINERASPYGAGWSVVGAHRLKVGPGDSLSSWDGAGTIQFWRRTSCNTTGCTYTAPNADFDQLSFTNAAYRSDPLVAYSRTLVDGIALKFDDQGRLRYVDDIFGNRGRYVWKDSERLDSIVDPVGKAIVFSYDGNNRLQAIRDVPGNRTTSFVVGSQNNLVEIQDPVGGKPFQQASYDGFHRLLAHADRRGARWSHAYDNAGKLSSDSTPAVTADGVSQRLVTTYTSSESAVLASPGDSDKATVVPSVGSSRVFLVDAFGALREVLSPLPLYAKYVRNAQEQVTEAYDSTGYKTYAWDGPRLMQEFTPAAGTVVNFQWNTSTNRMTRRYGNGTVEVKYFYDGTGFRLDSMKTTTEPATRFTYDSRGRILTVTDPKGRVVRTSYDANPWFNKDSVTQGSRRNVFHYEALGGKPFAVERPGGRVDSTYYDALNRVIRTAGPLGYQISYGFGDSLNLTHLTDPLGHTSHVEKNMVGWDTLVVDGLGRGSVFEYDKAGHLKHLTNRRGQLTQFDYDGSGRLTSRVLSDNRITNILPSPGKVIAVNEESSDTTRWVGDTMFEIAVRAGVKYTVRSSYDTTSRDYLVAVWSPGDNALDVTYDLDSAGRTQRVIPWGMNPDTLSHTPDGLFTGLKWHGSWSEAFQHRPGGDLARSVFNPFGLQYLGADFIQDTVGRTKQRIQGGGGEFDNYSYDARGRLTAFSRYAASPICPPTDTLSEFGTSCTNAGQLLNSDSFGYDAAGNRTDKGAVVDAANKLLRFNGDTLLYDADGNLTRRYRIGDTTAFNQRLYWNSVGQLDSARTTKAGSTTFTTFGYDALGRRVRKTTGTNTIRYVYSGARVVAEFDGSGNLIRRYTYLPGMDNPHSVYNGAVWRYYLTDGSGNVRAIMNSAGNTVEVSYKYLPFGDSLETSGLSSINYIRFGGRELDPETGLYYNRARYYDPRIARFVSEDGASLAPTNRYSFAANDPVNGRDPSGNWCEMRQGGVAAQAAPPVVPGSAPARSSSDADDDGYLYCEDLTGGDLWTIEAYLGGYTGYSAWVTLSNATGLGAPAGGYSEWMAEAVSYAAGDHHTHIFIPTDEFLDEYGGFLRSVTSTFRPVKETIHATDRGLIDPRSVQERTVQGRFELMTRSAPYATEAVYYGWVIVEGQPAISVRGIVYWYVEQTEFTYFPYEMFPPFAR
jgi:RHS repeat-associated protein